MGVKRTELKVVALLLSMVKMVKNSLRRTYHIISAERTNGPDTKAITGNKHHHHLGSTFPLCPLIILLQLYDGRVQEFYIGYLYNRSFSHSLQFEVSNLPSTRGDSLNNQILVFQRSLNLVMCISYPPVQCCLCPNS